MKEKNEEIKLSCLQTINNARLGLKQNMQFVYFDNTVYFNVNQLTDEFKL